MTYLINPYYLDAPTLPAKVELLFKEVDFPVPADAVFISNPNTGMYGRYYSVPEHKKLPSKIDLLTRFHSGGYFKFEVNGKYVLKAGSVKQIVEAPIAKVLPAKNEFIFLFKFFGPRALYDNTCKEKLLSLILNRNLKNEDGITFMYSPSYQHAPMEFNFANQTEGGITLGDSVRQFFPFVLSFNNTIDDCGFASLVNMYDQPFSLKSENKEQINKLLLFFFFYLELILSQKAYILFSLRSGVSEERTKETSLLRILYDIAKSGAVSAPIINPNNGDLDSMPTTNPFLHREGARGRELCAITHYSLLDYYQSDTFKQLNLVM